MNLKVKRPITVFVFHGLWILWGLYKLTNSNSTFGQFSWSILTLLASINLWSMLRKKNYFELIDNKLIINKDFFQTQSIDVDKIEKIDIEPGPFKYSRIILRDKTEIKFNDSYVDKTDLKEFMGRLSIPIE